MPTDSLARAIRLMLLVIPYPLAVYGQNGLSQPSPGSSAAAGAALVSIAAAPAKPSPDSLKVICKGDQLTISAFDIPLANILTEVGRCIGARIDIPPEAAANRFFDTIGPAPFKEVLGDLLNATGLNYVIGASSAQPDKIDTVLLMTKTETVAANSQFRSADRPLSPARRAYAQMQQNFTHHQGEEAVADDANTSPEPDEKIPPEQSPASSQAPGPASTETAPAPSPQQPASASGEPLPSQANPMDQQITSMEQMFEQRRQMIQNGGSSQQHTSRQ